MPYSDPGTHDCATDGAGGPTRYGFATTQTARMAYKNIDLLNDIFGVAFKYGLNSSSPGYLVAYDRGPQLAHNAWNLSPADGQIDLFNDIFGVAFQFGHHPK